MNTRHQFFTIITATYNASNTLPRLLQSLSEQSCQDFTWLCQDGCSEDNTLEIIEQWREKIPNVHCISEKDSGIYDAWNKALEYNKHELGQWILFLGADDELASKHTLEQVKNICSSLGLDTLFVAGDVQMIQAGEKAEYLAVHTQQAFTNLLWKMLPHSGLFARREIFEQHNFDPQFRIVGDYDWLRRVWTAEKQMYALSFVVTHMWYGGISSRDDEKPFYLAEMAQVYRLHRPRNIQEWPKCYFIRIEAACAPLKLYLRQLTLKYTWWQKCWKVLQTLRSLYIEK